MQDDSLLLDRHNWSLLRAARMHEEMLAPPPLSSAEPTAFSSSSTSQSSTAITTAPALFASDWRLYCIFKAIAAMVQSATASINQRHRNPSLSSSGMHRREDGYDAAAYMALVREAADLVFGASTPAPMRPDPTDAGSSTTARTLCGGAALLLPDYELSNVAVPHWWQLLQGHNSSGSGDNTIADCSSAAFAAAAAPLNSVLSSTGPCNYADFMCAGYGDVYPGGWLAMVAEDCLRVGRDSVYCEEHHDTATKTEERRNSASDKEASLPGEEDGKEDEHHRLWLRVMMTAGGPFVCPARNHAATTEKDMNLLTHTDYYQWYHREEQRRCQGKQSEQGSKKNNTEGEEPQLDEEPRLSLWDTHPMSLSSVDLNRLYVGNGGCAMPNLLLNAAASATAKRSPVSVAASSDVDVSSLVCGGSAEENRVTVQCSLLHMEPILHAKPILQTAVEHLQYLRHCQRNEDRRRESHRQKGEEEIESSDVVAVAVEQVRDERAPTNITTTSSAICDAQRLDRLFEPLRRFLLHFVDITFASAAHTSATIDLLQTQHSGDLLCERLRHFSRHYLDYRLRHALSAAGLQKEVAYALMHQKHCPNVTTHNDASSPPIASFSGKLVDLISERVQGRQETSTRNRTRNTQKRSENAEAPALVEEPTAASAAVAAVAEYLNHRVTVPCLLLRSVHAAATQHQRTSDMSRKILCHTDPLHTTTLSSSTPTVASTTQPVSQTASLSSPSAIRAICPLLPDNTAPLVAWASQAATTITDDHPCHSHRLEDGPLADMPTHAEWHHQEVLDIIEGFFLFAAIGYGNAAAYSTSGPTTTPVGVRDAVDEDVGPAAWRAMLRAATALEQSLFDIYNAPLIAAMTSASNGTEQEHTKAKGQPMGSNSNGNDCGDVHCLPMGWAMQVGAFTASRPRRELLAHFLRAVLEEEEEEEGNAPIKALLLRRLLLPMVLRKEVTIVAALQPLLRVTTRSSAIGDTNNHEHEKEERLRQVLYWTTPLRLDTSVLSTAPQHPPTQAEERLTSTRQFIVQQARSLCAEHRRHIKKKNSPTPTLEAPSPLFATTSCAHQPSPPLLHLADLRSAANSLRGRGERLGSLLTFNVE